MNNTEQKERLNDILLILKDAKEELQDKIPIIETVFFKIDNLFDDIYSVVDVTDSWDSESLKIDIITNILENSQLADFYEQITEFKYDIDEYISELPYNHAEHLEEKYINLDNICSNFSSLDSFETLENAIEHVEEAEMLIKEMINQ